MHSKFRKDLVEAKDTNKTVSARLDALTSSVETVETQSSNSATSLSTLTA